MNNMRDELIQQLVDPSNADLKANSNIKILWKCPKNDTHIWEATPQTRKRTPGCPVCANKIVLPGVNDLQTLNPELTLQLVKNELAITLHPGSHKKVTWRCPVESTHTWSASVVSRTRSNSGCPYCSGRIPFPGINDLATTHPEIANQLVYPELASTIGAGSAKKLLWKCTLDPSHTWLAPVRNRVGSSSKKATGCPTCVGRTNRNSKRHPSLASQNHPILNEAVDPIDTGKRTLGSGALVEWWCKQCIKPHKYKMSIRKKLIGQSCPVSAGVKIIAGINDLKTTHPELAKQLVDPSLADTLSKGSMTSTQWLCNKGHTWETPVYARVAGNGCPHCSPIGSSYGEQELFTAVKILNQSTTNRAQISKDSNTKIEVDVLSDNLAIEFHGTFWHSDYINPDKNRHKKKSEALIKLGFEPITVWSDDWDDPVRRAIIIRYIANRLGSNKNLMKAFSELNIENLYKNSYIQPIDAEDLDCTKLSESEAIPFFKENHLLTHPQPAQAFALRDKSGKIFAAMAIQNVAIKDWQITHYATSSPVLNGLPKLMGFAQTILEKHNDSVDNWIMVSPGEYPQDKFYSQCGFIKTSELPPDYQYTGGYLRGARLPKEFIPKDKDVNDLHRVYDAGKTLWSKSALAH